jgi:hypothetical protein
MQVADGLDSNRLIDTADAHGLETACLINSAMALAACRSSLA